MALKFKYKSKEEAPAEVQSLYAERDGGFVLDVEGAVEKSRVEEIRSSNTALSNQLAELKRQFEGTDPAEARKPAEEKQMRGGEIEKVIEGRVRAVRSQMEKHYAGVAAERDALNAQLTAIQIDQGVTSVATRKGLRPTAIPDITARARTVFKLAQGAPVAYESDGQTVRVGRDGLTPLSLDEWVDQQVAEAPHLFEGNSGAGSASGPSGPAPSGVARGDGCDRFAAVQIMKTCSYCGHENQDSAVQCAECGTAFPVPDSVDPKLTDPSQALVILATFGDTVQANLLKDKLEQAGIEACVPEELDPSPFGNFTPLAHVTVRVAERDLQAAQEVISATSVPPPIEEEQKPGEV